MTSSNIARDLTRAIAREVSDFEDVESEDIRRLEVRIEFLCRWAREGQSIKVNAPPWRREETTQG